MIKPTVKVVAIVEKIKEIIMLNNPISKGNIILVKGVESLKNKKLIMYIPIIIVNNLILIFSVNIALVFILLLLSNSLAIFFPEFHKR